MLNNPLKIKSLFQDFPGSTFILVAVGWKGKMITFGFLREYKTYDFAPLNVMYLGKLLESMLC